MKQKLIKRFGEIKLTDVEYIQNVLNNHRMVTNPMAVSYTPSKYVATAQ